MSCWALVLPRDLLKIARMISEVGAKPWELEVLLLLKGNWCHGFVEIVDKRIQWARLVGRCIHSVQLVSQNPKL